MRFKLLKIAGISIALVACFSVGAQTTTEFRKKNAIMKISNNDGAKFEFELQSSVGQNTCGLDGVAIRIDENRAAYSPEDKSDLCVAVFNFSGQSMKVTTKDCSGYCGMGADGSMDGLYKKR